MLKEKRTVKIYILYYLCLLAAWALQVYLVSGRLEESFSTGVSDLILDGIFKTVIWSIPAVFMMKRYGDRLYVKKDILAPKKEICLFLAIFAAFTVYILMIKYRQSGKIALAEDFTPLLVPVYLFVGFNEEIVFRGWLLNSIYKEDKMWQTFLLNGLMFLVIHFPTWILHGSFVSNMTSGAFLSIVFLSFVFSFSFVKTKNIIFPALLHFWWDLLIMCLK
ncbi:MAG: CPBP family intramembrane metalloprotease [Ruminococcus sp.]|nr:CPBP family intramembrane metalloprotease [Ruminococcus sp.]